MKFLRDTDIELPSRSDEAGNVLFILMIAVVLFAALGFTVANMLRQETPGTISGERAGLLAGEILDLGRSTRQAIQDLRISHDCGVDDISFEHSALSGYTHTPVAKDECKIFGPDGARLSYIAPAGELLDTSQNAETRYGEIVFSGEICVAGLPDGAWDDCESDSIDNEELVMVIPFVNQEVCLKINDALGVENPSGNAPIDAGCSWSTVFDGTYSDAQSIGAATGELEGKMQGCYRHDAGCGTHNGSYHFYQVLITR